MNERPRWPRRTLIFAAVLLAVDLGGARALDALGLVESLLAPSGARALLVVPLAIVFFAARLVLLFVAPGVVLAALVEGQILPRFRGSTRS